MPKEKSTWTISLGGINGFGGYCPAWTENTWPYFGNKNQASAMTDISLIDPNVLTQGPTPTDLTSGNEDGELGTNLIVAILKHATSANVSYACSADKVFKLSATAVLDANFPLLITGGTYQVATDLLYYQSNVYVFWNDTGTEGEIAKVTIATPAIDPDWGSTTPTGAAHLQDAPHYGIVGGDDVAYITNGRYVASLDTTTLNPTHLDFWTDAQAVSVTWNNNRVKIAVNRPNAAGSNFNQSGIYTWDGVSSSWEGDPIEVQGELGALYTKNGITFVWWKDSISTGGYCFGYISGLQVELLRRYSGSLPNQAQVGEYEGHISWLSSGKLMLWGAKDTDTEVKLFQYGSAKYTTHIGGMAAPFGSVLIASDDGTHYSLAKLGGYATTARYKTMAFPVSGSNFESFVDTIIVEFETLALGAKCDFTLTYNKGASTQALTQLAYSATDSSTRRKILNRSCKIDDLRLDYSWANGSVTNPFNIRSVFIQGHTIKNN